jgi:hypothetical protein
MELVLTGDIHSMEAVPTSEFNTVQINSIKHLHPQRRQESKGPTFALT